jgi:hypothetical protein
MPNPSEPIYIVELAKTLARVPGRLKHDREEAKRIAADVYQRYRRGEFRDDEILALLWQSAGVWSTRSVGRRR